MWIDKGGYFNFHETVVGSSIIVVYIKSHMVYGKDPPKNPQPIYRRLRGYYTEVLYK